MNLCIITCFKLNVNYGLIRFIYVYTYINLEKNIARKFKKLKQIVHYFTFLDT